jgi:hypothetical protein
LSLSNIILQHGEGEAQYWIAKTLKECKRDEISEHGFRTFNIPFTLTDRDLEIARQVVKTHSYGPARVEDIRRQTRRMYFDS